MQPATCWVVAGFVIHWERKKGNKTDWWGFFLVHSVVQGLALEFVSPCFPHSEMNKLGKKMESANPNQSTAPASPCITF